jgi:hypothetical protein
MGPFSVNVSTGGVGYSFGLFGFRITRAANGKWFAGFSKWGFGYREALGGSDEGGRRRKE